MIVPFVDLTLQYQSVKSEIDAAIASVMEEGTFVGGRFVKEFEEQFAAACGTKNAISCGNGTDSLYLILKSLGIGPGDEVITPANSWIASAATITQTGATAVFVDVHPAYYCLDETLIERKITHKTKAIIAVHLYGQVCDMDAIITLCKRHGLHLIEDCAQAHFSKFKGVRAGLMGIAGAFSFYPTKNLGAYGDAGCVITNDNDLAEKIRMFACHGSIRKKTFHVEGVNSRLDSMQAAILLTKLPYIDLWNKKRLLHAQKYNQLLSSTSEIVLPVIRPGSDHTFHLYVIKAQKRDRLVEFLSTKGIQTSIHYPVALPFLPAYEYKGHIVDDFPVAYQLQGEILSLPIFPELSDEQIQYTANCVKMFYS